MQINSNILSLQAVNFFQNEYILHSKHVKTIHKEPQI